MKLKLYYFVRHNFIVGWEDQQFKKCVQFFSNDIMVLVINFAENFSFEIYEVIFGPSAPSSTRWLYSKVHMLLVKGKCKVYI